jgi:integrase
MAREMADDMRLHKLTTVFCRNVKRRGRHADGGNLVLLVDDAGNKSWGFRFALDGRERTGGLGRYPDVGLADARERAAGMRKLLAQGIDPLVERDKERAERRAAAARLLTFREAANRFFNDREGGWRNEQHRKDFKNSLATHVLPLIGALSVADVDTPAVLKVLERDDFWRAKPQAANNVRARIEAVLDWAKARSYRDGDNPARWKGHLDKILPAPRTLRPVRHHPALPWAQMPAFMAELRGRESITARALEFTILTAVRVSEALGARWSEIDFAARTWTIPKERTKANREHVVPLSAQALEILRALPRDREGIFPMPRSSVFVLLRRRMGREDITVHGFRSAFRTWAGERTNFPREVAEAALAHVIKDKTERAYQRGTLLQKRRQLMEAWAGYCYSPPATNERKVVALHG